MGYYEKHNVNIEDAIIIDEQGNEKRSTDTMANVGKYSDDILRKVEALSNKDFNKSIYEKTSIAVKVGMAFCVAGVSFAVWKKKNWIAWGMGSSMAGLFVGNMIGNAISKNNISNNDKDEKDVESK